MSKIWHDKGEIEIEFPKEKFHRIIEELSLKGKKIEEADFEKIFLHSTEKFLKGSLFLEEFAEISGYLFSLMDPKAQHETELGGILYKCSELSFYIRFIPEDGTANNFNWFLGDVLKYYRARIAQIIAH